MLLKNIAFLACILIYPVCSNAEWKYIEDQNVVRVEEMHISNGSLYCRAYYDGYSKQQKNDYFLCKLEGNKFVPLCGIDSNFPQKIDSKVLFAPKRFAVLNDGSIYTIFDNSIYQYKNSMWSLFYQDSVIKDTILELKAIHKDCFENVWLIQEKKVIFQSGINPIYKGVGGRLIKIKNEEISIAIDTIYDDNYILKDFNLSSSFLLNSDSKGNIISTESNFLFIFNQFSNNFKTYNISTLNSSNLKQPLNIFVEKSDRVWIIFKNNSGCSGGLVSIFNNGNWEYIGSNDGLSDSLSTSSIAYSTDICLTNDTSIWISSNWGVIHLKNKIPELILPENVLPQNYPDAKYNSNISCITEGDNGEIYLGAYPGLLIYSNITNIQEEYIDMNSLTINPNPVSESLSINSNFENGVIEIYNQFGQKVMETEFKVRINASNLQSGIYFVKINGKVSKFVKL